MSKSVAVKDLLPGDVLVGSGFTVTHKPWRGVRTPARKMAVEGFYPGSSHRQYEWNAYTVVRIQSAS